MDVPWPLITLVKIFHLRVYKAAAVSSLLYFKKIMLSFLLIPVFSLVSAQEASSIPDDFFGLDDSNSTANAAANANSTDANFNVNHKLFEDRPRPSGPPVPPAQMFRVIIKTGNMLGAGTNAHVFLSFGDGINQVNSFPPVEDNFERGRTVTFDTPSKVPISTVCQMTLGHDRAGFFSDWYVDYVTIQNSISSWTFPINGWIGRDPSTGRATVQFNRCMGGGLTPPPVVVPPVGPPPLPDYGLGFGGGEQLTPPLPPTSPPPLPPTGSFVPPPPVPR